MGQLGELQQTGRILSRSRERNLFLTRENSGGRIKENRETIPPSSGRRNYSGCSAARARSGSTPTHNPRRRFPQAIVSLQREIRRVPEKNSQQDVRFSLLPLSSSAASCVTRRWARSTPGLIVSGDTLRTSADSAEHPNCWHNRGSNRVDGRARVPRSSLSKTNERDASIRDKIYFEPELFFRYEFISYIIFTKRINHRIIFRLQIVTQLSMRWKQLQLQFVSFTYRNLIHSYVYMN